MENRFRRLVTSLTAVFGCIRNHETNEEGNVTLRLRSAVALVALASTLLSVVIVGPPAQARWRDNSGDLDGNGPSTTVILVVGAAIGVGVWALVHHHNVVKRRRPQEGQKRELPLPHAGNEGMQSLLDGRLLKSFGRAGGSVNSLLDSPPRVAAAPHTTFPELFRATFEVAPGTHQTSKSTGFTGPFAAPGVALAAAPVSPCFNRRPTAPEGDR